MSPKISAHWIYDGWLQRRKTREKKGGENQATEKRERARGRE